MQHVFSYSLLSAQGLEHPARSILAKAPPSVAARCDLATIGGSFEDGMLLALTKSRTIQAGKHKLLMKLRGELLRIGGIMAKPVVL